MAIKQKLMVKTVLGNTDLELSADPGESFLIKDIQIYNPASNYVTLQTEKTTIGYFRVGGELGSHLPFFTGRSAPLLPTHEHTALEMTAADTLTAISATDVSQAIKDGKGAAIDEMGVRIGATGTTVKTASIPTSTNIVPGGVSPMLGQKTLLAYLIGKELMAGYPVAVGETFRISGAKQAGAIQMVTYEIYEAEDMASDAPNGSKATEYLFVNYGNTGATINTIDSHEYDNSVDPAEFPDFPFGGVVPAKTIVEIIGVLGSDFGPGDNATDNWRSTEFLKFVAERITLFDDDRNGLLMKGPEDAAPTSRNQVAQGQSMIGNYSDVDMKEPMFFPEPLVYAAGDDLDIYLTLAGEGTAKDILVAEQEIGLIQLMKREE